VDASGKTTRALPTVAEGTGFRLADAHPVEAEGVDLPTVSSGAGTVPALAPPTLTSEERRQYEMLLRHASDPLSRIVRHEHQLAGDEEAAVVDPRALCYIRSVAAAERAKQFGENPDGERQLCDGCGTAVFYLYRTCNRCACELCLDCAAKQARRQRQEVLDGFEKQRVEADAQWRAETQRAEAERAAAEAEAEAAGAGSESGEGEEGEEEEAPEESLALSRSRRSPSAPPASASTPRASSRHPAGEPHCAHPMEEWRLCARFRPKLVYELVAAAAAAARRLGPPPPAPAPSAPNREPLRLRRDASLRSFQEAWRRGEPILVAGVGAGLREAWTPHEFSRLQGGMRVVLVALADAAGADFEFTGTVGGFFTGFDPAKRRAALPGFDASAALCSGRLVKLKDFPPLQDFADLLPRHHADWARALPFPDYTARKGRLNLASALPDSSLPPDLGPKMYAAYGAYDSAEGTAEGAPGEGLCPGSTKLHMDMSDAVNVLAYVQQADGPSEPPVQTPGQPEAGRDGRSARAAGKRRAGRGHSQSPASSSSAASASVAECCADELSGEDGEWLAKQRGAVGAVWDIWRAEDTPALVAFLRTVAAETSHPVVHPIHDQSFYLGQALRTRLADEAGVRGWRFVQREGEAVFIPAGCPHQVLNLRSCIKIAQDFVSPEHLGRILSLTDDFRALPHGHRRREDLLGVKAIIAHAAASALSHLGGQLAHQPHHQTLAPEAGASSAAPGGNGSKHASPRRAPAKHASPKRGGSAAPSPASAKRRRERG